MRKLLWCDVKEHVHTCTYFASLTRTTVMHPDSVATEVLLRIISFFFFLLDSNKFFFFSSNLLLSTLYPSYIRSISFIVSFCTIFCFWLLLLLFYDFLVLHTVSTIFCKYQCKSIFPLIGESKIFRIRM